MPLRMMNYWLRLYWQYGVPVKQVLIWLKETENPAVFETEFKSESTQHKYKVLRLWEQDPQTFLQDRALLPLAVLCKTKDKSQLLSQVAGKVASIEDTGQRQELAACTQVLAGLRFNKNLLKNFFREEIMQESVIYQDILQKGVAKGLQQGLEQGLEQGKKQGQLAMIMKMLNRRLGTLDAEIIERIESLTTPELEELSVAFWDFSQVADLVAWLESR
jgi:predicted transposase/invertase (TIGR01784 family)